MPVRTHSLVAPWSSLLTLFAPKTVLFYPVCHHRKMIACGFSNHLSLLGPLHGNLVHNGDMSVPFIPLMMTARCRSWVSEPTR